MKTLQLFVCCVPILFISCKGDSSCKFTTAPQTTWAVNYTGALYSAEICGVVSFFETYSWNLQTESKNISIIPFYINGTCLNTSSAEFLTNCAIHNNCIYTNFAALAPLDVNYDNSKLSIKNNTSECLTIELFIEECSLNPSSTLHVDHAANPVYQSTGTFNCADQGELFYSNGTKPFSAETTCLSNAMWQGHDSLQCWKAPVVELLGPDLQAVGFNVSYCCNYTSIVPPGNTSIFHVDEMVTVLPKNECFILTSVKPSDSKKRFSCQAVTPYTQIYNDTGRSSNKTLEVFYPPYQNSNRVTCMWMEHNNGSCLISYFANPEINDMSLTKSGVLVHNDAIHSVTVNVEEQTFHFERSQVNLADNGTYLLMVMSYYFTSSPLYIEFDVIVEQNGPVPPSSSIPLIVGVTVGSVAFVASLLAFGYFFYRNYQHKNHKASVDRGYHINPTLNLQDEESYVEVNKRMPVVRQENKRIKQNTDYENLADNVDVTFGNDGYIELSATCPKVTKTDEDAWEAPSESPTYETI